MDQPCNFSSFIKTLHQSNLKQLKEEIIKVEDFFNTVYVKSFDDIHDNNQSIQTTGFNHIFKVHSILDAMIIKEKNPELIYYALISA